MLENSSEVIDDCIFDLQVAVLNAKNTMIDIIMFDYLVEERLIPELIKLCKSAGVSRYDLIDFVKEEMVESLLEDETLEGNKYMDQLLQRDIEMIPVNDLSGHLDIEIKRLILFNISKKFPSIIKGINTKAVGDVNYLVFQELEGLVAAKGKTYEKCFGGK